VILTNADVWLTEINFIYPFSPRLEHALFGGISHDLRTPITRMKITVEC
jgi:hypothetical protein